MEKVRVAVIGCGGRSRAHLFEKMDDVEVVAVADPIEERRIAACERFGCTRMYKDHNELFANESTDTVDALLIAVEPTAHVGIEEGAIEKGFHFIVEKPITLDIEQGDRIAAGVKEKNLITSVGFQDRYLDLMDIIKAEMPKHKGGGSGGEGV